MIWRRIVFVLSNVDSFLFLLLLIILEKVVLLLLSIWYLLTCVIRARVSVWLVWSGLECLYDLCDQGLSVCMTCVIRAWVSVWLVWSGLECLYDLCDQGLSILLNTCNLRTADRYTEFADHVTCVSLKCEEAVPVVNRRLVYLYVSLSMFTVSLH